MWGKTAPRLSRTMFIPLRCPFTEMAMCNPDLRRCARSRGGDSLLRQLRQGPVEVRGFEKTTAPPQLLTGAVAHGGPRAERLCALRVRLARPATPLQADPVAGVARTQTIGQRPAIFTALSVPFGTRRNGSAASSIAKSVAALAVVRAFAFRYTPRPGSRCGPPLVLGTTVIGDHLVERREWSLVDWPALSCCTLRTGSRCRCRRHDRGGVL
jgi:hypothetical protein